MSGKSKMIILLFFPIVPIEKGRKAIFGPILKFCISAEELSQLFCRIHRKFKVPILDNKWFDSIGLGILSLNLD